MLIKTFFLSGDVLFGSGVVSLPEQTGELVVEEVEQEIIQQGCPKFRLVNPNYDKKRLQVLGCYDEAPVALRNFNGKSDQEFYFDDKGAILSEKCNKALWAKKGLCGSQLLIRTRQDTREQEWIVREDGAIENRLCNNYVLTVNDDVVGPTDTHYVYVKESAEGDPKQQWIILCV